jgi:hypothetical protein
MIMKLSTLSFGALVALPVLFAFALPADELAFRPAAGSTIKKKLELDMEMSLVDASMTMNGEPMPAGLEEIKGQTMLLGMVVGVGETYVATVAGRPTELLRSYDKLAMDVSFGDQSESLDEFTKLEGKTVRFKWNADESVYDKSFVESEGDVDSLKELSEDMDLRALLPEKAVSEGDSWEVSAKQLMSLFMPGGFVGQSANEAGMEGFEEIRKEIEDQLDQALKDFKVVCTYKGARDSGGVNVGEIAFNFDGKAKMDLSSLLEAAMKAQRQEGMPEMDMRGSAGMEMQGAGTLLWDLASGHMHDYVLHADLNFQVEMHIEADQGGEPLQLDMSGTADGTLDLKLAPDS